MRILTATQADNVALESNKLQQGYLSYALLQEGLNAGQADFKAADGTIFLDEWLQFGVERVPKLYQDIRDKKLSGVVQSNNGRKDVVEEGAAAASDTQLQQPYLFDFTKRRQNFALARKP
jgi:hypothetical protein